MIFLQFYIELTWKNYFNLTSRILGFSTTSYLSINLGGKAFSKSKAAGCVAATAHPHHYLPTGPELSVDGWTRTHGQASLLLHSRRLRARVRHRLCPLLPFPLGSLATIANDVGSWRIWIGASYSPPFPASQSRSRAVITEAAWERARVRDDWMRAWI